MIGSLPLVLVLGTPTVLAVALARSGSSRWASVAAGTAVVAGVLAALGALDLPGLAWGPWKVVAQIALVYAVVAVALGISLRPGGWLSHFAPIPLLLALQAGVALWLVPRSPFLALEPDSFEAYVSHARRSVAAQVAGMEILVHAMAASLALLVLAVLGRAWVATLGRRRVGG